MKNVTETPLEYSMEWEWRETYNPRTQETVGEG